MPTYTIIAAGATPGPGEINAGQPISVASGDVYIIDASADADISFVSSGGGPHDFDVTFSDSLTASIKVTVGGDLTPTVTIADNVDLSGVDLAAIGSTGLTLDIGNNASLGKLDGSGAGADHITIGNDFTALSDWNTTGGADVIIVGDNATFGSLKTGVGDDSVTFGDGATFNEIDTEAGNDTIWLDDNAVGNKIKAGGDDDTVRTGSNAQITTVDGGAGTDSYTTQTAGTNPSNMESTTVVCFMQGTRIETINGEKAVEALRVGDLIWTLDDRFQPLRWIGQFEVAAQRSRDEPAVDPVRVRRGALAPDVPSRDLYLSQQHRLLVRSRIANRMFAAPEILVAAKNLVGAHGIDIATVGGPFTYFHLVFDRHAVIRANGAETESMLLAPQSILALSARDRARLFRDLAVLEAVAPDQPPVRPILQRRARIERLVERTIRNRKPLQEPTHALAGAV